MELTARQIFKEPKNVWYEGWTKNRNYSKDNSLLLKHVCYYDYQKIKNIWYMHKNALVSVNMWKLENHNLVFYYQNGDTTGGVTETNGVQTLWQKITLLKYRKDGCNSMDATFGTNDLMYHLFTLVVFDDWHNEIPIA